MAKKKSAKHSHSEFGAKVSHGREVIGKKVLVPFIRNPLKRKDKVMVEMKVLDLMHDYGMDTFLVEPVSGSGKIWVRHVQFV